MAADVNGDGKDDIVAVYDYGARIKLWVFLSNGVDAFGVYTGYSGCSHCWTLAKSQLVAADVNGDGKDDIVGAYDYGNKLMKMWSFVSDGTFFSSVYRSYSGCTGCWNLSQAKMLAADVDGDGKDDIVGAYDYGNKLMKMWRFASDGSTFATVNLAYNGCAGCWSMANARMLPADVNGDGKDDIVGAYDYGSGLMGMWSFLSGGSTFSTVYKSYTGCSGCWYLSNAVMLPLDGG
jgi:hypothetical protein